MHYRSREFSLVHEKSDNNFYIILSIHGHGLKQLALGAYSSSFVHIILSVSETVKLLSYELVGGHCSPLTFLKTLPTIYYTRMRNDRNFPNTCVNKPAHINQTRTLRFKIVTDRGNSFSFPV